MTKNKLSPTLLFFGFIATTVIILGNYNNPPNGRTGAPGETTCASCHNGGGGFDGEVTIENFPATITPSTSYNLTAKVTNPNGAAVRGGFQAVVLNTTAGNANVGDIIVSGTNPTTQTFGGREYVEHNPGLFFPANNEITWDFTWESPSDSNGDVVSIFVAGNIANGNGGTSGDRIVTSSVSGTMIGGGAPLTVVITASTDVLCFGGDDGTAITETSGGDSTYTYIWSNGENSANALSLPAGLQSVTVTDGMGATSSASLTIGQPDSPVSISIVNQTDIDCNNPTGSATASASGGTPGYIYLWDNGQNMATATNLTVGLHVVTATDANGCTAISTVEIGQSSDEIIIQTTTTDVCFGECDATVTFFAAGGTGPYSYETDAPPLNICAGVYGLTVTDALGCSESTSFEIFESIEIIYTLVDIINETNGQGNGAIVLDASGGTAPLSFNWILNGNTVSTDEDPTGLSAGDYTLIITDSDGCSVSMSDIIIENLVATSEQYASGSLLAFPNPSDDLVFIHLEKKVPGEVEIALFDMSGKELGSNLISRKGELQWILDVNSLAVGVYTLRMNSADGIWWEKLVRM